MNNCNRTLAILNYREYDRLPLVHFGYWHETLIKWAQQGHIGMDDATTGFQEMNPLAHCNKDYFGAQHLHAFALWLTNTFPKASHESLPLMAISIPISITLTRMIKHALFLYGFRGTPKTIRAALSVGILITVAVVGCGMYFLELKSPIQDLPEIEQLKDGNCKTLNHWALWTTNGN